MVWYVMISAQQELLSSILAAAPNESAGMSVYIGNRRAVAVRAFSSLFPTVQHLLGDAFNSAVLLFIQQNPPESAEITLWGAGFASWLEQQEELISYPYVAAVADLEWRIGELERAADTTIDLPSFQLLQELSPNELRVVVNQNSMLLNNFLPVYNIWKFHQESFDMRDLHNLNNSICDPNYVEYLCISRIDWKVNVFEINKNEFDLLLMCRRGDSLGDIIVELTRIELSFSDWLVRMLKVGAILGYSAK